MIKKIFFLLILSFLPMIPFFASPSFAGGGGGIDVSGGELEIFLKIPENLYNPNLNWCLEDNFLLIQEPKTQTTLFSLPLTEQELQEEEWLKYLPICDSF